MRQVLDNPGSVVTNGRFNFGTYAAPFRQVNPLDADVVAGVPLPRAAKSLRLKEWQAIQIGSPRFFLNVALFNAKLLALVQVKCYERQERRKYLFERKVTPWSFELASSLLDSKAAFEAKDCHVVFHNRLAQDYLRLELSIPAGKDHPPIYGSVTALTRTHQPQVVCIPFAENRGMYSHKGLVPVEGELTIGTEAIVFSPDEAYGLIDDHKGYYPYEMIWDWATGGGHDRQGRLIGFNLTHNQSIDEQHYNENCFWVDGRLHLLPPVSFARHDDRIPELWRIRDSDGLVDLTLTVETDSRVDINALILRSRYRGPFGHFTGRIASHDGEVISADGLFGMGEDFYLRC
jgi:hypothetical protein